ncbi:MAG TPA: permease, partial [Spirochaetia bacterium]|nr:permease [Spirochaetia bacterium]
MLLVIPPIFILLGLLDVWVPREKMIRYMGEGSGVKGTVLAFLLGSFAAGPLYGAFPFAAVLMKKGSSFRNILVFIGAWSTTKIPMLLFEMAALGKRFALSRLAIDIVGILIIAWAIKLALPRKEVDRLYAEAERIG